MDAPVLVDGTGVELELVDGLLPLFEWEEVTDAVAYSLSLFRYHKGKLVKSILLPRMLTGDTTFGLYAPDFFKVGTYKWRVTAYDANDVVKTSLDGDFKIIPVQPSGFTFEASVVNNDGSATHSLVVKRLTNWVEGFEAPILDCGYDVVYSSVATITDEEDPNFGDPLYSGTANLSASQSEVRFENEDIIEGWDYTVTPFAIILDEDGAEVKVTGTPATLTTGAGDANLRTNIMVRRI